MPSAHSPRPILSMVKFKFFTQTTPLNRLAFNFVVLSELGNIDYTNLRISFNEPVFTHSQKVGEETESEEKVAKNVHD